MTGRTTSRPLRAVREVSEEELSRLAFDGEREVREEGRAPAATLPPSDPPAPIAAVPQPSPASVAAPEPAPAPATAVLRTAPEPPQAEAHGAGRRAEGRLSNKTLRTAQRYVDLIEELSRALDVTENKLMRQIMEPQLDRLEAILRSEGPFEVLRHLMKAREGGEGP